jgi:hypothetical protein
MGKCSVRVGRFFEGQLGCHCDEGADFGVEPVDPDQIVARPLGRTDFPSSQGGDLLCRGEIVELAYREDATLQGVGGKTCFVAGPDLVGFERDPPFIVIRY